MSFLAGLIKKNSIVKEKPSNARNLPIVRFTTDGKIQQFLALPLTIINYILKHPRSFKDLQKLYKTCKYFYFRFPVFMFPKTRFNNGYFWEWNNCKIFDIKNRRTRWWFRDELLLNNPMNNLAKNIFRCEISFLCIKKTVIKLADFEILTAENTINDFCLQGKIIDSEGKNVPIDIILSKLPNLQKLWYYNYDEIYSAETMKKLISLKFRKKMTKLVFCFDFLKPYCDPKLPVLFFEKNAAVNAEINLYFVSSDSRDFETELKTFVDRWLKSYATQNKPKVLFERINLD